jgi:hypothetical protein
MGTNDKIGELEQLAAAIVRGAGRYGGYLTTLGFEVAGFAEWLEDRIPRVGRAVRVLVAVDTRVPTSRARRANEGNS